MNSLEQLKKHSTVVADTGDFQTMRAYAPQDATTNPSLILKAVQKPEYRALVEQVLQQHKTAPVETLIDHLLVAFGIEILRIVPGRVSTEIDARLSFDSAASVAKARDIIALYQQAGIPRERVLIKIAATWEGIQAARVLEQEGIHCNLTLLFCLTQAAACAQAGVQLISPFVGRIYDWYKKSTGQEYAAENDPGVQSVQRIYRYYKEWGYRTEIMGASFRNVGQILALAGCDLLTISPELLNALQNSNDAVNVQLKPELAHALDLEKLPEYDKTADKKAHKTADKTGHEAAFRYALNEDAMATEKLAEGIRLFARDTLALEKWLQAQRVSAVT